MFVQASELIALIIKVSKMAALPVLKSITLEDALTEIAFLVQAAEADKAKNPTDIDNVQVSVGTNGNINISASLPATITIDATGHPSFNVTEYLT